ncbi:MAG: CBS domain-containing protein [Thermodesulfobacteriota bacterium]
MHEFIHYEVKDVMIADPITVGPETRISEAEAILAEHDFNGLPVVEGDRKLIGMVTKLDILRAFIFTEKRMVPEYQAVLDKPVAEVMARDPRRVEPETPLTRVLQRMIDTRHKSFPVVEDGRLVGIIAREDVLRALRRAARNQRPARLQDAGGAE